MSIVRKAGTTDVSVVIRIIDSTDGTPETGVTSATGGLALEYRREGAVSTAITEADLTNLNDAHSDGGMKHIGNGYYRLDLPDAACASGSTGVLVHGAVTGMVVIGEYVQLVAYDAFDAVRLGLTSLPNAAADAAGGLPISDAGGLDLDAKLANTNEVTSARMGALTDWIDGGRLDLILDARASQTSVDDLPTNAELATSQAAADDATLAAIAALSIPSAATIADAVWDEALAGHVGAGSAGEALSADLPTNAELTTALGAVTLADGSLTAAKIAASAFTAAKFASGAIDAAALATDAAAEIRDSVWAKVFSELTGDPTATPTAADAIMLPFMSIRNKHDTDSGLGTDEIHNSAGSVILTAAITDAAGIFSKAKYA